MKVIDAEPESWVCLRPGFDAHAVNGQPNDLSVGIPRSWTTQEPGSKR